MLIFLTFSTYCFYCLDRRFFVLEYRKTHFPGLYCVKQQVGKMANVDQNHGLTPLEKCQIFKFLNFLFLLPTMRFFVLEYHKHIFLAYKA